MTTQNCLLAGLGWQTGIFYTCCGWCSLKPLGKRYSGRHCCSSYYRWSHLFWWCCTTWPTRSHRSQDWRSPLILLATVHPAPIDIKVPHPIPMAWLSEANIWVNQWSILEPKLSALKELVLEQLALGYLEPLTSRCNTLSFVLEKKSEKYGTFDGLQDSLCMGIRMTDTMGFGWMLCVFQV